MFEIGDLFQVLLVGDFNIAATQQDVHDKLDREAMYPQHEKELFDSILAMFTDVWRKLHPDTTDAFTVWDEKTSARAFNEVGGCLVISVLADADASNCSPDPALLRPATACHAHVRLHSCLL